MELEDARSGKDNIVIHAKLYIYIADMCIEILKQEDNRNWIGEPKLLLVK